MKILQISSAQSMGGGERHLADLANGLAERGHELYVALRPNAALRTELRSIERQKLITLPLRNSLDAQSARALKSLVRKHDIDIVHAHMARDYPLAAFAVRGAKARLIVTRHVLFELNRLHRITLANVARVIAVSNAVASQLIQSGMVQPAQVSVVLNGIDTRHFRTARLNHKGATFRRALDLPDDSLLVGTVGELTRLKGQVEFAKAAAEVIKRNSKAHFVIAGVDNSKDQKHKQELVELISQLGLQHRTHIVPWLEDIAELYCALDVFVSASHTESFGLAIAEAMATGTAVIATTTEGAREVVQSDKTGLLVPVGNVDLLSDAIETLLEDEAKREQLADAAMQAAQERFDVKRMIDETEQIYNDVLETV